MGCAHLAVGASAGTAGLEGTDRNMWAVTEATAGGEKGKHGLVVEWRLPKADGGGPCGQARGGAPRPTGGVVGKINI